MTGPGDIYDGSIDNRSAFPPLLSPFPATPASPPYLVSLLSRRRHRAQVTKMQDSLPSDEPFSTCANPGSVEMISEATESEANRPEPQESTDPHEPLSHASSDTVVEVVSKKTKSEAGITSLGSRIPPELFDDILFYVNVDRVSQRTWSLGEDLKRHRGEPSARDILTDLKRCSLVCIFWANRCREHMFSGRTLEIKSYEDAAIFRRYVVEGCPKLTPVHQLIRHVNITQNYSGILAPQDSESRRSFIHLLYLPAIQDKLDQLFIKGPVPAGFNPANLDTPHWGIPPSVVVPSSFLRNNIQIRNVHFPSFSHVIKYIRHFSCTTYITFEEVTWDGQTPTYSLPHASSTIVCQRRPHSLEIEASGDCTNSVHLALTALMMNPNCPLHRLSDEERMWMIKVVTLMWGHEKDPDVSIEFNVSEQTTTMELYPFHFVFDEAPATDRPDSALSVVGLHVYIARYHNVPANFDALVDHASTQPTIRALVLLFDSLDDLQVSVKPFVGVLAPVTETIELVLAYEKEECIAVGVDLVTLEPNARIWTDLPVLTYDTYDDPEHHLKSLYILQRQLEKKPRGRFH